MNWIDDRTTARDLKLVEAAMRKKWAIPDTVKELLGPEMALIALDRSRDTRSRIAAARVLQQLEQHNVTVEALEERAKADGFGAAAHVQPITYIQVNPPRET